MPGYLSIRCQHSIWNINIPKTCCINIPKQSNNYGSYNSKNGVVPAFQGSNNYVHNLHQTNPGKGFFRKGEWQRQRVALPTLVSQQCGRIKANRADQGQGHVRSGRGGTQGKQLAWMLSPLEPANLPPCHLRPVAANKLVQIWDPLVITVLWKARWEHFPLPLPSFSIPLPPPQSMCMPWQGKG